MFFRRISLFNSVLRKKLNCKIIKRVKVATYLIVARFMPCARNSVFFYSFTGLYNDNPKYISEKLHELNPNVRIAWLVSDYGKDEPPSYVKKILYGTWNYYYYVYSSRVVVDNWAGLRTFEYGSPFYKILMCALHMLLHKNGQLNISTWHGTPLKKIGQDSHSTQKKYCCPGLTYITSGCEYTKEKLERAYDLYDRVKLYGTPRNDILFCKNDVEDLKRKLGLPLEKKVVLFAPTFRDYLKMGGVYQIKTFGIERLLQALSNQFGGDYVFVFRLHQIDSKYIMDHKPIDLNRCIINGNIGDDMAEYLSCTDVLITDYSGSMFDFALTGRPCFLFSPDREEYCKERGMYIDYSTLPFPIADTFDALIQNINGFSSNKYENDVRTFLEKIGNVEDGRASERIVADILAHLKACGDLL